MFRINQLNHTQIKYDLLDKWLPLSSCAMSNQTLADFTLDLGGGAGTGGDSLGEEDADAANLLRCVYILQDGSDDGIR